ncbi:hypothetical protein [Leifsonia sp. C5G2]|jgi:hypothetical protein|uniref:hypothetical protein n=1 Tax=Leifsonia sp. C5G2 TaxID=2735269 RepID=UPI0015856A70|nr:hypothetical protein [Leifsonia sp. C5G2]NUU08406.1 hypothetical protein [Leifsonia sp. C5G2]
MFRGNKVPRIDRDKKAGGISAATFGDSVGSHFLLGSLDQALTVATECEALLDSINHTPEATRPDARAALRLRVKLADLEHALDDVTCRPEDEPIREEAKNAVSFYELMLKYSVEAWYSHLSRDDIRIRRSEAPSVLENLGRLREELAQSLDEVPA